MKNPVHSLIVLVILSAVVGCGGQTATATHQPTNMPQASDTAMPTAKLPLTDTPIPTNQPRQPTYTPEPTRTFAPTPSQTTTPTYTATTTGTPEPTVTAENTQTVQPAATTQPTATLEPTNTPAPTATATEVPPTATPGEVTMENMFPEHGRISGGGLTVSLSEGTLRAGGIESISLDPEIVANALKLMKVRWACAAAAVSYNPKATELNPDIVPNDPKLALFNVDRSLWDDYDKMLEVYEENENLRLKGEGFDYEFGFGEGKAYVEGVVERIEDHLVTSDEWNTVLEDMTDKGINPYVFQFMPDSSFQGAKYKAAFYTDNNGKLVVFRDHGEDYDLTQGYGLGMTLTLKYFGSTMLFGEYRIGRLIYRGTTTSYISVLEDVGCGENKGLCKDGGIGNYKVKLVEE